VSTSDGFSDREVAELLNELIDLVREIKQIEWITHRGAERQALEELEDFLVPHIDAIADIEARTGSPLARIVTPSAHLRAPLGASSAPEAVRERLVPHLRAVTADVREHARNLDEAEAEFLTGLADGLDRHAEALSSLFAGA
jgi:hypothetical protein